MKVIEKGHVYELTNRKALARTDEPTNQILTFINKEPSSEHDGTTTQEVLRVLLDRTRHCNNCMPHRNNEQVIYHLRMALIMHEARALERKVEKGELRPEYTRTGDDGHFELEEVMPQPLTTTELNPYRHDWDRQCNHPTNIA